MEKQRRKNAPVILKYRDSVFRLLFKDKTELLSLFNAINGTNYKDSEELEINTLENAIYMSMKNDLSCILDFRLNLYEHQSTVNPNMPLRDLFYVSKIYEKMVYGDSIYDRKPIEIPVPRFVIFYNGEAKQPERREFRLSDLYSKETGEVALELVVVQLNINPGYNKEIKENCEALSGYMKYVEKIRNYSEEMELDAAIDRSVKECIKENILAEFFRKNRAEVIQMSLFEYDEEAHMRSLRRQGEEDVSELYSKLLADGRLDDLRRSTEDRAYRRQLMVEYGIEDELEEFAFINR